MTRIALDGMGGDRAPGAIVDGAVQAARTLPVELLLVGQEDRLGKELSRFRPVPSNLKVIHASEVIEMAESPAISVRKKRDSSICRIVELAKGAQADAVVSAGNTGAMVCAATLGLRLLEGIERPGIAILLPSLGGPVMVIDVGANVDTKPGHLFQYGVMGSVYMERVLGKKRPAVGLLNIGEEETKGTDFTREAFKLLEESSLHFIGNAEGRDIFTGRFDVIVCDGFVGNVALKVSEGMAFALRELLKLELKRTLLNRLGAMLLLPAFNRLRRRMDYAEYGGAPLLGVDGACFICHGSSSPKAIRNAIRAASTFVSHGVNRSIIEAMRRIPSGSV
ncbi:MAG: phosphate acyltransferase PlsX [Candidatus Omnitrophica bacterium]|nr:phosphate acyltransferase PlsX [Candidatus Omnitrophota bacterium]